jgi:hypothetical protein
MAQSKSSLHSTLDLIRTHPSLPDDIWYFVAAAALCGLNQPQEVAELLGYCLSHTKDGDEQLRRVRRIREALIKSAPVVGLPKVRLQYHPLVDWRLTMFQVITSLLALKRQTPAALLDSPDHTTVRTRDFTDTPAVDVLARGREFFNIVYGKKSGSLMKVMDASGTPDLGAAGRLMYSFFLSNTSVLSGKETMFVTVTGAIVTDVSLPSRHSYTAPSHYSIKGPGCSFEPYEWRSESRCQHR